MSPPSRFSSFRALGRRYFLLFSAGTLSDIGGFTTSAALILHVYKISGESKTFMGLTALATLIPMVLAAPIGGVWAEKFNRKWIMIANDVFRTPIVLAFMFADNVWVLLGLQSMIAASTALFMPSRNSMIPEVVEKDQVHLANSVNGGVLGIVHVLGPVFGATIYAVTGSLMWVVILDATTYVASAALLGALDYRRTVAKKEAHSTLLADVVGGLRYVKSQKDFLHILTIILVADAAIGLLIPLLRPFIAEVLHGSDVTYGYLIGAFGVGGMIGPVTGYWAGKKLGLGRTLQFAFVGEAMTMLLWSRVANIYVSLAVLFSWGVVVFTLIPCFMSYVHSYAKAEFMGRTFALFDQTAYSAQIVGAVAVMIMGNRIGSQVVLTWAGLGYLAIILLTMRTDGARLMRSRRGRALKQSEMEQSPTPADALAGAERA